MAYSLFISEELDARFKKMAKKDRKMLERINNKAKEILKNPHHFKPLRGDMAGSRRVHIEKSFVLIFDIDEKASLVRLLDFEHHEKVY
ncbi:MAG: type II toxin-antitoxin system mRNA interferase toxin, RelE/StbE family [Candidatus Micrarchaeota archaeon]